MDNINVNLTPGPCPFCGRALVWQEGDLKKSPPLFPLWKHPASGCFADYFAVVPGDVPKWNRRTRA